MSTEKSNSEIATLSTARVENVGSVFDLSEKAIVRRIDYRIVSLMFFCYLMQFLDKVMINVSF